MNTNKVLNTRLAAILNFLVKNDIDSGETNFKLDIVEQTQLVLTTKQGHVTLAERDDLKTWLQNGRKCSRAINKAVKVFFESGGQIAELESTKTINVVADIIIEPSTVADTARNISQLMGVPAQIASMNNIVDIVRNMSSSTELAMRFEQHELAGNIAAAATKRMNEIGMRTSDGEFLSKSDDSYYDEGYNKAVVDHALNLLDRDQNTNFIEDAEYTVVKTQTSPYISALEAKIVEVREQQTYDQDAEWSDVA